MASFQQPAKDGAYFAVKATSASKRITSAVLAGDWKLAAGNSYTFLGACPTRAEAYLAAGIRLHSLRGAGAASGANPHLHGMPSTTHRLRFTTHHSQPRPRRCKHAPTRHSYRGGLFSSAEAELRDTWEPGRPHLVKRNPKAKASATTVAFAIGWGLAHFSNPVCDEYSV